MHKNKQLILIELNELNFDFIKNYLNNNNYNNFEFITNNSYFTTKSENEYEKLEPWIQWVSAHTGLSAEQHKIFRLGDITSNLSIKQIFETIESKGYSVGCISPMNASNNLKNPKYFIPDPWTNSNSDNSFWSQKLSLLLKQVVNDNAKGKITKKNFLYLILFFLKYAKIKNYINYLIILIKAYKKKWYRALFLDYFLNDVHLYNIKKFNTNFSTIFFNAAAHIQHHYFLSSRFLINHNNPSWYVSNNDDPIRDMLNIYNKILKSYKKYNFVIATGLSQTPIKKSVFYYRLKDHNNFLTQFNINFSSCEARMSRDFLINFDNIKIAKEAEIKLGSIFEINTNKKIFSIDNRGSSLFVTLIYNLQIDKNDIISLENKKLNFLDHVVFVAIKNGIHNQKGFYYSNVQELIQIPKNFNVKNIYNMINNYF